MMKQRTGAMKTDGLFRMSDWEAVLKLLHSGGFVLARYKRYSVWGVHDDHDEWPCGKVGGLTAPLYHALRDTGMLTYAPHGGPVRGDWLWIPKGERRKGDEQHGN